MVHLALENYPKIKASDVEFKLSQPNYTVNTLAHLHDKFPQHQFCLIMGEDNLYSLPKWKNYEVILSYYPIYVYPRLFDKTNQKIEFDTSNITKVDAPIVEISSTAIRDNIKHGKNVRPLLPESVWQYIDHNLFYR